MKPSILRSQTLHPNIRCMMLSVLMLSALVAIANLTSCKSSASVAPIILKDSVSITYKQGQEQPSPSGLRGAQTDFRKNSCVPAAWCPRQTGKPYLGKGQTSTQGASVFEEVLSERTNKPAVPPTTIRVDTVFIERWHTEVCQPQAVCQRSGRSFTKTALWVSGFC